MNIYIYIYCFDTLIIKKYIIWSKIYGFYQSNILIFSIVPIYYLLYIIYTFIFNLERHIIHNFKYKELYFNSLKYSLNNI